MREGRFDLVNTFANESKEELNPERIAQFEDIHRIMIDVQKGRDLTSVSIWAVEKRPELLAMDSTTQTVDPDGDSVGRMDVKSDLEFKIIRLQFVGLLQTQPQQAVDFARENFPPFPSIT